MDVLVAETVMEWRERWVRGYRPGYFVGGHFLSRGMCLRAIRTDADYVPLAIWVDVDEVLTAWCDEWHPSTDIAAAWQVDKREWRWEFKEDKHRLTAWLTTPGYKHYSRAVWWHKVQHDKIVTYCLIRCRLALAACGVTVVPDTLSRNREILHGDGSGEI
jgi:hypothetical protein